MLSLNRKNMIYYENNKLKIRLLNLFNKNLTDIDIKY